MTTLFISHSSKDKRWAEAVRTALGGQGYESFLDSHPEDGIPAGAKWERRLWQGLKRSRGVVALCTADWLASPWCVAEAMIARERGKPVFLLAAPDVADDRQVKTVREAAQRPRLPDFLKDTQFISLAGLELEEVYRRLMRGLKEEGLHSAFKLPGEPYPGLRPFQASDAAVFFGRDTEIDRVVATLNRHRRSNAAGFVLILGASGCGKSSLVRAGVVPRLEGAPEEDDVARSWIVPEPILGGKGLEGLIVSLGLAFKQAGQPKGLNSIRERLAPARRPADGLEPAASALLELASELLVAHEVSDGHVVLILDQLEEVFATPEDSSARASLRLLLKASAEEAGSVVVLATMRSDFLNDFQLFPGAGGCYEEVTLDPMPRARFGELIEGPAERFGLELGPGLSERLVEDTRYDDALPLLAFALERLYAHGGGEEGRLTIEQYETLFPKVSVPREDGATTEYRGVSAAIKHVADAILTDAGYIALPEHDPRMGDLRRAFYSLARVGETGQFTRRIALRSQIPRSCDDVLERFVDQRLLVKAAEEGEPTLRVAHEALFRVWDTLRGWLVADRKALALRGQLEDAAAEWDGAARTESRQWPDERILDAMREVGRSGVALDDVSHPDAVRAFLGPTDPDEIARLPSLGEAEDDAAGSGRYGDAWRLPLGHEARASVGVRLALLGDRRRGVGLRDDGLPDIAWCPVACGTVSVEVRADPANANSEVVDTVTRSVERFAIARYPITVAQFRTFLEDCYHEGAWRLPPGAPFDFPADYPAPEHRARHDNHPADSVNWYDAIAFCHWLGARLGYEVGLPTEFQWQLAATGGDAARVYPWGPDWDPAREPWRANTVESRLNRSTAVGLYPRGESPAGALDMAGTVWEWCLNAHGEPDEVGLPSSGQDRRVLRGGSWSNGRDAARSASRAAADPYRRSYDIGFRVLCSSPILDH